MEIRDILAQMLSRQICAALKIAPDACCQKAQAEDIPADSAVGTSHPN
jgi:hypothetical protein